MKKSTLHLVNDLQDQLLQYPHLVRKLEGKDPDFVEELFKWINTTERILETSRISAVSEVSGIKSSILAMEYSRDKRTKIRKEKQRVAAESVQELQAIVHEVLKPLEVRVKESKELIRQLLHILSDAQAITYDPSQSFDEFISSIWNIIETHDQLKSGAIQLKTHFAQMDINLLLAEEVQLENFSKKS